MRKLFVNCHHLLTEALFTIYVAANYLVEQGAFKTRAMRRNQLKHMSNETENEIWRKSLLPEGEILLSYQLFVVHLMFHIGKRVTKQLQ